MAWNEPGGNNKDRDPWSGGKKSQTPPDLDEALRKMQQKLKRVFSGKGGDGGDQGGSEKKNIGSNLGFIVIGVIVLVLWVLSGIFIVDPAEQAVILRFGRYVDTVGPGPHWIPRFIDSKYLLNVQKVSNFSYNASMLTKDENIVSVAMAVQYRIGNTRDYLFNVVNPAESLQQATASALRQVIGHTTLDEILTTGREQVREDMFVQLKKIMDMYQAGIEITDVNMQPAKAPEEVKDAFDDAIKAQEDEQRFINQAQAYARGVEPRAEGKAQRILQEAQAYRQQVTLRAKGEVAKFLAILPEYQKAPSVTRDRLYLDAVESVLSKSSKILLDVKGSNNLVYLPLDRFLQKVKDQAATTDTTSKSSDAHSTHARRAVKSPQNSLILGRTGRESYRGREDY